MVLPGGRDLGTQRKTPALDAVGPQNMDTGFLLVPRSLSPGKTTEYALPLALDGRFVVLPGETWLSS